MSSGSNYSDDISIGDCTMYEHTAKLIINDNKQDLPKLFSTILTNSCEYNFTNDETEYDEEYKVTTIPAFKEQHTNHSNKNFGDVSAKFQLLYLIINKYNQNVTLNDAKTADNSAQIENDLKTIPSSCK